MEEIVRLTKDLIAYKTTHNQPEEISRCADFVETYLTNHGISYRRFNHEGVPSILVAPQDATVPVMLMAHIDVVDGPAEMFVPYEKDGKLFGRGSIDDKYAVALSLVLLKEHWQRIQQRGGSQGELPLGILITGDEEVGGANGARKALSRVSTDFCIALDGGRVDQIIVKEKGIVHLKLIAEGKTAHAARPWLGTNAIENLIADYHVLRSHFEVSAPDHWHRTLNFSRIQAGKSINQVPDYAEAVFDIRYTASDDMDKLVEEIRKNINGRLVVEKIEPVFIGGDSPHLDLLLDIHKGISVDREHGASDARFLSQYGIKGIVWGADGELSQHSETEHVSIESIGKLYGILDRFLQRVPEIG
jgi:succinyl-diaminopimelate desuccinylase